MEAEHPTPVFPGLDAEIAPPEPGARTERVIVGIDGSAESRAALGWALRYARRTGSPVDAIAAWQFPPPRPATSPAVKSATEAEAEARRWLEDAAAVTAAPDSGMQLLTLPGEPVDVLLERATGAGLIVLGNKARAALAVAVLGSVVCSFADQPSVGDVRHHRYQPEPSLAMRWLAAGAAAFGADSVGPLGVIVRSHPVEILRMVSTYPRT